MQFDDAMLESELDAMIRTRVEDTANAMPDASGRRDRQRREIRTNRRTQAFRAGRCGRGPRVPEPRGALFESAVIERHRRRGPGVEEALMEMCPAGVSTRRVDGTGRLPWGGRMPSQTPSDRLEHVCAGIGWVGGRPLGSECPCVFVDGVWRRRSRGGRVGNVGILVAVGIDADGRRGRIRANDTIGRPNREIRRRTRVAGRFPDGNGALMLVYARIRYVTANG